MKFNPLILSSALFLFVFFNLHFIKKVSGQNDNFLNGKIFNTETGQSIPFATIQLKKNKIGVISNSNGDFILGIHPDFQSDSVLISSIGFQRKALAYKSLESSKVNIIYLVPTVYKINEVTVFAQKKKLKSEQIIRLAIQNIKNNYPRVPFNYTAYYRDYQKNNGRIFNLNEALVYAEDNGFDQELLLNKFRLLDFKKNKNFPVIDIPFYYDTITLINGLNEKKIIPYGDLFDETGNELLILLVHDAIRNFDIRSYSFVNVFAVDFIPNHIFSKPKIVSYNDKPLYKIHFELKPKSIFKDYDVKGEIYIQPENYAIFKLEYSCFSNDKSIGVKKILYNITTEYDVENSTDSLMHLKYISFNNSFDIAEIDSNAVFKVKDFYANSGDLSNSSLIVEFNRTPDYYSVSNIKNYKLILDNKEINIKKVIPRNQSAKIVLQEKIADLQQKTLNLDVNGIWDTQGNLINKMKTTTMYQFREIFVQQHNTVLHFTDNNYLEAIPLGQNQKSAFTDANNFWMNSPEFKKTEE